MEEEKPTGKRRGSPLLEGMKTGERGSQQVLEGESALCLRVTTPEWTSAPAYLGYRQGTGICSGSSPLGYPFQRLSQEPFGTATLRSQT